MSLGISAETVQIFTLDLSTAIDGRITRDQGMNAEWLVPTLAELE
jgi:hypothetical protein